MAEKRKATSRPAATIPPNKKVRAESTDDCSPDTLCLTGINSHCLLNIFDYLELSELLNVADTSRQLSPVVSTIYKRKYGQKTIRVKSFMSARQVICVNGDEIFVNGFPMCLRFLRCFGLLINQLEIGYCASERKYRAVLDHYISEFCAPTVIKIIGDSKRERMPNFSKFSPNVQRLELEDCNTTNMTHTAGHLPILKDLIISNPNCGSWRNNISANIILSNPQLKNLKLHWNVNLDLLRTVSEHLEELESLDIIIETWDDPTTTEILTFKNVKRLRFGLFCMIDMPNINMSFVRLEDFTLGDLGWHHSRYSLRVMGFIGKHPQIIKFKCETSHYRRDAIFKKQIVKLLPSLEELDLRTVDFEVKEAIDMMEQCAKLQVFQFNLTGKYDLLRLSEGWSSTIDNAGLVKLQRQ